MLDIIQWAGSIGIVVANLYIVSHPKPATIGLLISCLILVMWAVIVAAWGVMTMEILVSLTMLWNIRLAFKRA